MNPIVKLVFPTKQQGTATLATAHAPKGGITIRGKFFPGGRFIEDQHLARATPEQKSQLEWKRDLFDPEDWKPPARQMNIFDEMPDEPDEAPRDIQPVAPAPNANPFPVAKKEKAKEELNAAWRDHDLSPAANDRVKAASDAMHGVMGAELDAAAAKMKAAKGAKNLGKRMAIAQEFAKEHGLADVMMTKALIENHASGKRFGVVSKAVAPTSSGSLFDAVVANKEKEPVAGSVKPEEPQKSEVKPPVKEEPKSVGKPSPDAVEDNTPTARKIPGKPIKLPDGSMGNEYLIIHPDGSQTRSMGRNGADAIKRATEKKVETPVAGGKSSDSEDAEPGFDYSHAITAAAGSIDKLRQADVFRVMDSMKTPEHLAGMADYISANLPDLAKEVAGARQEIDEERGEGKKDFGAPDADRHDAIHKELSEIYANSKYKSGDSGLHAKARDLETEMDHHKPAAVERAQKEIDAENAKNGGSLKFDSQNINNVNQKLTDPAERKKLVDDVVLQASSRKILSRLLGGYGRVDTYHDAIQDGLTPEESVARAMGWDEESADEPESISSGPAETKKNPHLDLSDKLAAMLDAGEKIDSKNLFDSANESHGGTRAEGKYGPSDAYDSLEAGFNKHLKGKTDPTAPLDEAIKQAEDIKKTLDSLPTQTNRSGNKDSMQQFSTPPHYAFAASWLANLSPNDVVLEPSAGTGSLAVHAANSGAKVFTNELDENRANHLKDQLGDDSVYSENAEQISGILPKKGMPAPSVVIMNPPFSQTAGRLGDKKDLMVAANHIDEGLELLQDGGRLVAIVGRGMSPESPTYREWFRKLRERGYTLRGNVGVSGKEYTKYGTSFDNRVLIIDKKPSEGQTVITGDVDSIPDLMKKLEEVRNDRPETAEQSSGEPDGGKVDVKNQRKTGPESVPSSSVRGGMVEPNANIGDSRTVEGRSGGSAPASGKPARGERSGVGNLAPADQSGGVPGESGNVPEGEGQGSSGKPEGASNGGGKAKDGPKPSGGTARRKSLWKSFGPPPELRPVEPIEYSTDRKTENPEKADKKEGDEPEPPQNENVLFEKYRPSVDVPGIKSHPASLVESSAMSAIDPPKPTYKPHFSPDVISKGMLSEVGIEPVIYAGQSHSKFLPAEGSEPPMRQGYFVGDGTGAGKGRQIAGIITDNFNQGRKKAVWISEKAPLIGDALRDWSDLGNDPNQLFPFEELKKKDAPTEGISFLTYDTLRSGSKKSPSSNDTDEGKGLSNVQRIVNWLGKDFDGVIAFDESHNMGNATDVRTSMGVQSGSAKALAAMDLQRQLPNARIVYISATGATDVRNLAYADRLGLWGRGTAFPTKADFIAEMENGGVSAMEAVAQHLKAAGLYNARSLAMNDGTDKGTVKFDRVTHELTHDQQQAYDTMADGWQKVLHNIDAALELTGGGKDRKARAAAVSQFWGAHQRFFNQLITSFQTPTVIAKMEQDLKEGRSPVIQLVNTMEAATKRALAKKAEKDANGEDTEMEEFDVGPGQILSQFIEHSFPTTRYQETMDADGNIVMEPVKDSQGNYVEDPQAVKLRDRLLDEIGTVKIDSPLDMILNHFGHDNVSEVTGRTVRLVPDKDGKMVPEKRTAASANVAETNAFQSGKKKILVFSEAGGTGRSYHANLNDENQERRSHYVLQPGWRADKVIQGLGRTHRTNQDSAPLVHLVEIGAIKAQRRFISTIARRLEQLGALTKGQREAGSSGLFSASDNLESKQAQDALDVLFNDLRTGRIEGLAYNDVMTQMGLREPDERPGKKPKEIQMTQFLNRLLSLKIGTQNKLFNEYDRRLTDVTEAAIRNGTIDTGLTNYKAERIEKVGDKVVFSHPQTGATARLLSYRMQHKVKKLTFEQTQMDPQRPPAAYIRNVRSGQVWAVYDVADRIDDKVRLQQQYLLRGPTGHQYMPKNNLHSGGVQILDDSAAEAAWDNQYHSTPDHKETTEHFISGAFLPIWDRLPQDNPEIFRVKSGDGSAAIGRLIPQNKLQDTLRNLGTSLDESAPKQKIGDPKDIHTRLESGQSKIKFANGWTARPVRVGHERRIELSGPQLRHMDQLEADGVFRHRIDGKTRFFIPTGSAGAEVLERIAKDRPIIEESSPSATLSTIPYLPPLKPYTAFRLTFPKGGVR